ncbi:hypothetical protein P3X46_002534 [Hevea brasiliensis]|uniref:Uncharacterized protein n=1 Tax=Hevea brasiliensis TaxID=3981 RepID=A0ABQ9N3B1_HEVBR|nr:hypothetical protein P3X46_002534 [Hevea brasiliensis]
MAISTPQFGFSSISNLSRSFPQSIFFPPKKSQVVMQRQSNGSGRRVWRGRKLMKKDDMLHYKLGRIPFLEEQVRKVREGGELLTMDIERLLLSEDNRFDFVSR